MQSLGDVFHDDKVFNTFLCRDPVCVFVANTDPVLMAAVKVVAAAKGNLGTK